MKINPISFLYVLWYQYLLSLEEIELAFDKETLVYFAQDAMKNKTGARGLRGVLENYLQKIMYDAPILKKEGVTKITLNMNYINTKEIKDLVLEKKVEKAA